ncbi:GIY-YIG nuclease family protein [Clostridium perfringens]|uniref:GIY-YIG nuclease family protein n=1 Tax=Clostridium perfringens TaxID=1502 RepID=UPI002AC74231|nr:GIY-YIG nuclease family protein [Clostridium perfringens]MDZ4964711.1 GIY-YIG nuclease family protein [Clostridium perfringens]MDZ5013152.1 GIY-YIG nuclease family protein [Clostridium perfringens]
MSSKNLEKLLEIFNNDEFELLKTKPKENNCYSEDKILIDSFEEINKFYNENKREPKKCKNINETRLFFRLNSLRNDKNKIDILKEYDMFSLLESKDISHKEIKVESISDIFNNDSLGILGDVDDIFTIKNIPQKTMNMPSYIASRIPCKEFNKFENLFIKCQNDLRLGARKLRDFKNGQQIKKGQFFILKGVMLYVAEIGEFTFEKGVKNARLRCIFENGTESDMLMRSLSAELYKNGRRITENKELVENKIVNDFNNIDDNDNESGYIYVLKSESNNPKVKELNNLYKIGFSRGSVEDRIKNCENEATFLMDKVKIVTTFKCYNLNISKFESIIHNFFGQACLDIEITDINGNRCKPREWFIVPLNIIEEALKLIINGQIIYYRYDFINKKIIYK